MHIRFRIPALVLVLLLMLSGCSQTVGEIAGNVADAAVRELEVQVRQTLEEYKIDVLEVKSTAGKLNDDNDSDLQFFCAVLVRSNSDALPRRCADALGKLFRQSGISTQTRSEIDSDYLVNKSLSFKHTDFSQGNYYLIWVYTSLPAGNPFASETEAGVG